jgi:hypothetical protein
MMQKNRSMTEGRRPTIDMAVGDITSKDSASPHAREHSEPSSLSATGPEVDMYVSPASLSFHDNLSFHDTNSLSFHDTNDLSFHDTNDSSFHDTAHFVAVCQHDTAHFDATLTMRPDLALDISFTTYFSWLLPTFSSWIFQHPTYFHGYFNIPPIFSWIFQHLFFKLCVSHLLLKSGPITLSSW